jgi:nicotinamidase-related amidase
MPTEPFLTIEGEPDQFERPPIMAAFLIIHMQRDFLDRSGFGQVTQTVPDRSASASAIADRWAACSSSANRAATSSPGFTR